jgi:transcriptional regulator NrdR family protein
MQCPYCGSSRSTVDKTVKLTTEILRLRQCLECMRWYETREELFREVTPRSKQPEQTKLFETKGGGQ